TERRRRGRRTSRAAGWRGTGGRPRTPRRTGTGSALAPPSRPADPPLVRLPPYRIGFAAMVDYEQRGRVAVLTINRPEARNAVNGDVANGMEAAIDRLEDDPEVWVGVVTGAG